MNDHRRLAAQVFGVGVHRGKITMYFENSGTSWRRL
jgi:ribosomal protein L19E